jgi:hypothetical protein
MALPKLESTVYSLTLPSTGKDVKFRPFVVKEYKALLIAAEEKNEKVTVNTVKELIDNCTFHKLKIDELPLFDLEYIMLRLRAKSVGEIIEFYGKCSCDPEAKTPISLNLDDIQVTNAKNKSNIIKISDQLAVKLKYPTSDSVKDLTSSASVFDMVVTCIEQLYFGEDVYNAIETPKEELVEFVGNLSTKQFEMLESFFEDQPKLAHDIDYQCVKCGTTNHLHLEGLADFFT